jgi:hypothetical protein
LAGNPTGNNRAVTSVVDGFGLPEFLAACVIQPCPQGADALWLGKFGLKLGVGHEPVANARLEAIAVQTLSPAGADAELLVTGGTSGVVGRFNHIHFFFSCNACARGTASRGILMSKFSRSAPAIR